MSMLSALVRQSLHTAIDAQEINKTALVMEALCDPCSAGAHHALVKAQDLGADLRQVGTLALVTNTRSLADLLKDRFGVPVEEYRSTGEEGGMDCRPGYPLLAALAYANKDDLQRRALAWGASPSATWQVDYEPGDYKGSRPPFTVSWASQVIGRGDVEMAAEIMAAAGPVDAAEQARRFCALLPLRMKIQDRNDSLCRFRDMMDLLAPGGVHALELSPWDIRGGHGSVAASLVGLLSGANTAFSSIRALEYMMPWIQDAARPGEGHHWSAAMACISPDRPAEHFPAWCVDQLTPAEANKVLNAAWPVVVSRWITANSDHMADLALNNNGQTAAYTSLAAALKPLSGLVSAVSGPGDPAPIGNLRHLLGCLDLKVFCQLNTAGLDAIEALIPVHDGSSSARRDLDDLHGLFFGIHRLRAKADNGRATRTEEQQVAIELNEIHRAIMVLHASYDLESGTPAVPTTAPRAVNRI